MKKTIWFILPILIIAVVLVAVFVGQRNMLSEQVSQLETDKADLSRQLSEADIAARTAQELADSSRAELEERIQTVTQEAETKVQEAETKAQTAQEALEAVTTERDALQASATDAAAQLAASIQQVQDVLNALVGGNGGEEDSEATAETKLAEMTAARDAAQAEAEKAQADLAALEESLAAVTAERDELQKTADAAAAEASAQVTQELEQTKETLEDMIAERDHLQAALEAAQAQAVELTALQETLANVTAQRDELQKAYDNAAVIHMLIQVLDAEEKTVLEYTEADDLKLEEVQLEPGAYTIRVIILNSEGAETMRYDLPYIVLDKGEAVAEVEPAPVQPAEEQAAEQPAEEKPAEEKPAEEQPTEEPAPEKPAEEKATEKPAA